jgi:MinD-like ATPase involved in chromosome partitioning or flagellar assembly
MVAQPGKREGVIDTDIQSPGIHVLFGLDEEKMDKCLNDYLWGKCARGGSLRCGAHFEDG